MSWAVVASKKPQWHAEREVAKKVSCRFAKDAAFASGRRPLVISAVEDFEREAEDHGGVDIFVRKLSTVCRSHFTDRAGTGAFVSYLQLLVRLFEEPAFVYPGLGELASGLTVRRCYHDLTKSQLRDLSADLEMDVLILQNAGYLVRALH
jgi:hypothetical protein